jgi:asparagine synthase (glutamine-hydrolysing)
MCGIFGVLYHNEESVPDECRLKQTARLLKHRGPDDTGICAAPGVGLIHTRLSLLDLSSRSNQPFWDKGGRFALVYNGEIYNFQELRARLQRQGITFRTTSDTEVLLESLIRYGPEATVRELEGMFAFALYDQQEHSLTLARDPFGIKPLFICDKDDVFIFASEVRAFRPWFRLEPDMLSISSYLLGFSGPTKGRTFYSDAKILSPGTVATVRSGQPTAYKRYASSLDFWDPALAEQLEHAKPHKLVDQAEALLLSSVNKQLIADVPVATLCSGGLDSSVVTAMAARSHPNIAVFHANVIGPKSEYEAAWELVRHLKLDLKVVNIQPQDSIDLIPDVIEHFGQPFTIMPGSVPFLMLSRLVRTNDIKAVLTGEGSDECFLGYRHCAPDLLFWLTHPRSTAKRVIKKITSLHAKPRRRVSYHNFLMGFSPYCGLVSSRAPQYSFNRPELVMALSNQFEVALETEEIINRFSSKNGEKSYERYVQSFDLMNYNLRSLLHRGDALGMAASIEARFPFLDRDLVRFAVNLPQKYRVRFSPLALQRDHCWFIDKWILRKVADRYLPRNLSQKPKQPFNVGVYRARTVSPLFFNDSFVADLFDLSSREIGYLMENADADLKLKLIHLEAWGHVCLNELPKQSIADRLRAHAA